MSGPRVSAYADCQGDAEVASISPRMTRIAAPGTRLTSTSQLLGIVFSLVTVVAARALDVVGVHRQAHGVQRAVRRHRHAIDHRLHEEQSPPSRPLLAAKLELDVRNFTRCVVGAVTATI